MPFLVNNNIIPYLLIAIMGLGLYLQYTISEAKDDKIKELEASNLEAFKTMNIIQTYNEERLNALEKVRATKWKEGKHEAKF